MLYVREILQTMAVDAEYATVENVIEEMAGAGAIIQTINQRISHRLRPITILIGTEAVIGLIGNILILLVYFKFYKPCNFRYFVLFLAVYDLTSCFIALPGEMYLQLNWFNFQYDSICKIKSYFNVFTAWGSAFTLCLLACDRYRKVCKPLSSQMHPSRALKLCVLGIVLSICVAIPDAVLWGKQSFTYEKGNHTLYLSICEKANKYKDEIYPFIYIISVYIVPLGIMIVIICTLNFVIARKMFFKKNLTPFAIRESSSRRQEKEKRIFTIFGNIYRLLYNASYHSSSRSESNNDTENSARITKRDITITLSSISLESLSKSDRSTKVIDPVSAAESHSEDEKVDETNVGETNGKIVTRNSAVRARIRRITESSTDTELRVKKKTLIMLILTSVFVLTITVYVALISVVAEKRGNLDVMRQLENADIVIFLFFLRLYFVNCIINPLLYGLLDVRFRTGMKRLFCVSP